MMDQILSILQKYGMPPDQIQRAMADFQTMGVGGDTNTAPGFPATPGGGPTPIPPGMDPRTYFLRQTPGYNFAFDEGQRAVQTSAAARGTLLTGGTLKALARYGTGAADQLYGNTLDRYGRLAELGQKTATAPF